MTKLSLSLIYRMQCRPSRVLALTLIHCGRVLERRAWLQSEGAWAGPGGAGPAARRQRPAARASLEARRDGQHPRPRRRERGTHPPPPMHLAVILITPRPR